MNNSNQKIRRRLAIGASALCIALSIPLAVGATPKKRSSAEIGIACVKWLPKAKPRQMAFFVTEACDSQHPKDRVKFRACFQNAMRKITEIKAAER